MNEDTRIVVHAYAGDAHQVRTALSQYEHHQAPVVVLSPADSPVRIVGTDYQARGKRAYTGQLTLDRQREHLEVLLGYSERFFLLHDSDSICLEPQLPEQLYAEPDTVWYNPSPTARFLKAKGSPPIEGYENVFQPPLFCSRESIEKMLDVSDEAMAELPAFAKLIDWYFVAMTRHANLEAKPLPYAISRPIWNTYEIARVYAMVRTRGFIFLHSVKTRNALETFVSARAEYNTDPDGEALCGSW
jgi:hypothetical protein